MTVSVPGVSSFNMGLSDARDLGRRNEISKSELTSPSLVTQLIEGLSMGKIFAKQASRLASPKTTPTAWQTDPREQRMPNVATASLQSVDVS